MPDKDPNIWAALLATLQSLHPSIQGAMMATVIALLRVIYDGQETSRTRMFLEAAICGCLSLSCSSALGWFGAPEHVAVALGGGIGFIGVTKLRDMALGWLSRRANKDA